LRPLTGADVARLVTLAAIWGASFYFFRILAPVLGPVATAAARVIIGGLALVVWLKAIGFDAELARHGRHYAVIGVMNSAIPFSLFAWAALTLPASYSAILNATAPLFSALLGAIWLGERLTSRKLAGLVVGMAGVALVTRAGPVVVDFPALLATGACLVATFCYAATGVYVKRRASAAPPRGIAAWSQVAAGAVLLPLVPFSPPVAAVTLPVVAAVLALALLCSSVAYVLYFRLMADLGPTRTMTVTFLIPVFGMLWGVLFLGESVTGPMLAGAALIVVGTGLIMRGAPKYARL
jgi:drug/metabolite transporter (DMT)-like permease